MPRPVLTPAEVDKIAAFLDGSVYVDWCRVERDEQTGVDSRNNPVVVPVVVESGPCILVPGGLQPGEQEVAGRLGWTDVQTVLMPRETLAVQSDRLLVNDRPFEVGGVQRSGFLIPLTSVVVREMG